MSESELEAFKAQWSKIYEAVDFRGRPDGFSYHLDIPRFVGFRDNILTLINPQLAHTRLEFEWLAMMEQCACGARGALADAIRFITGREVQVEFETYDGSRRTHGISDDDAAAFVREMREQRKQERDEQQRAEQARRQPSNPEKVRPSQTITLQAELIPIYIGWPGTGAGALTISAGGTAAFTAHDGVRTHLGALPALVSGYEVDGAGNLHLDFGDVKIATGDMDPIAMTKFYIAQGSIPPDFLGNLAYWGIEGVQEHS